MSGKRDRLTWRDRLLVGIAIIVFLLALPFMLIAALLDDGLDEK